MATTRGSWLLAILLAAGLPACGAGGGAAPPDAGDGRGPEVLPEASWEVDFVLVDAGRDDPAAEPTGELVPPPEGGAEATPEPFEVSDAPGPETATPAIAWGPCPAYIALYPGFECAFVPAPLDHDAPDGASLDVFVYRYRATSEVEKRQIWFLQGGPGGSGADFAQIFVIFSLVHPEWEMYSLDHRGVGNTARLSCPQEADPWSFDFEGCAEALLATWGSAGLRQFTTTAAARDVGLVVDLAREPGVPVVVYGASYGTYWGLRYLQLFPDQADAVVLDSICSPGACHLDEYDRNFNETGKLLLQVCAGDPTCAGKLATIAPTPFEALGAVFARLDDGTLCNGAYPFLDRPTLRLVLALLEMDAATRVLIPALIYRLARCDANDRAVLEFFYDGLQQGMGGAALPLAPSFVAEDRLDGSLTLGTHVIAAELLGTLSLAEAQAIADEAFFSTDAAPSMLEIAESGAWPITPDDGFMNRWGATATPLLMLNGTLDPQTTLAMAEPAGAHYTGAHQTFVAVDEAPHGVLFSSYTYDALLAMMEGSYDYLTRMCGFRMFEGFVADPTAPVDTTCLGELVPLEFDTQSLLNRYVSLYLFGTEDLYEGGVTRATRPDRPPFGLNPVARWRRAPDGSFPASPQGSGSSSKGRSTNQP